MTTTKKAGEMTPREFSARLRACRRIEARAEKVAKLSPAERRELIAAQKFIYDHVTDELNKVRAETAPPREVIESDLLELLMAVGAEFVARYFPTAERANFYVTLPGTSVCDRVSIPMPIPATK